jgi:predicted O-linked N-acetylglucosamine transferase (SPINDLY family)
MPTISEAMSIALRHHQAGRLYAAEQIYRRVLAAEPNQASAWHLLGVVACQAGKYDAGVEHFRRAIQLNDREASFHSDLGNALREQGKLPEAIASFRRALELKPDYAEALSNLGNALQGQQRLDEAVACYRRALELKADLIEAQNNLGVALKDQGQLDEAVACYHRALALKPHFAEAHSNLGVALKEQRRLDAAVACYRRALELKPACAEIYHNLGTALKDQGKLDEAIGCYRRALELKPDYVSVLGVLVHELQHVCRWEGLEELSQRIIRSVEGDSPDAASAPVPPLSFVTLPVATTAQQQLRCAMQLADRKLRMPIELRGKTPRGRPGDARSKLTIGYLSADYRAHATACLIAELFERHDRGRFAVFGYSYGPDDGSPMRRRLAETFDRFVDVRDLSFLEAARRIAADEVDILVDLKGYTMDARAQIAAYRPAPVQVSYLGYPGTMGAPFMDYILVDDFVVPADQQPFFSEKLVHLPGCYQVNDSRREISPRTPSRAECGLPEKGFVLCSFNNSYKITPQMFSVWMELLEAVPGSVLWLFEGNRFAPANLRREAEARQVDPKRLVFAPRKPLAEHLARHRVADLFLDTFPVGAHTTASDALWAGCPLLTLVGETFVSRVAGSLLRSVGLPELVARSLEEYQATALRLASDPDLLAGLRARLEANRKTSPLFDAGRFAQNIEEAYRTMWEIYASGQPPRAFSVR